MTRRKRNWFQGGVKNRISDNPKKKKTELGREIEYELEKNGEQGLRLAGGGGGGLENKK